MRVIVLDQRFVEQNRQYRVVFVEKGRVRIGKGKFEIVVGR